MAQGSLSTDIPVPPPPMGTPEIVNGPDATVTEISDSGFWSSNWAFALIPILILGWVGFAAYLRKVRARNRRLIYNT
jgi:hypothetical protein